MFVFNFFTDQFEFAKETSENEKFISLRKTKEEDNQFNFFGVTPEFQNYIAKNLATILDKKLNQLVEPVNSHEEIPKGNSEGGIKLFSDSKNFIEISQCPVDKVIYGLKNAKKTVRRHHIKIDELKNLVVSGETVLAQEDLKYWSSRTKGKVFYYAKSDNGQLVLKE